MFCKFILCKTSKKKIKRANLRMIFISLQSQGVVYLDDDGFPIHRESPKGSQQDLDEEIDSQNLREVC